MTDDVIDVERLVEDLRERVARRRAEGAYGDDVFEIPLEIPPPAALVRFRPELAYSTKPVVGRALTAVKQGILRLLVHVFDDMARQTSTAVRGAQAAADNGRRWSEEALAAEADARTTVAKDVQMLLQRLEGVEAGLERLQLGPRLSRLERDRRAPARPAPLAASSEAPTPVGSPGGAPLDYLAFEARFRGSEETIRERQRAYLGVLGERRRIVDVGCGRGELVALLREQGVDAYGVEIEPDFLALLEERGIPAVAQDAIEHLTALKPGAVDGIVLSHVIEHMPAQALRQIIDAAVTVLPEGGLLLMETPNPESLLAGSINFHRDPTHLRPVHPDTLAFMCETAGFSAAEILRLSPVPERDRLPSPAPVEGALGEHLDRVVVRLNEMLYGFQDYAVLARR